MYADDIVLIAESEEDLQLMLDKLTRWCSKWRMLLNTEKTQIVHFRHKNAQKTKFIFKVAGTNVKIVNRYRYLGVTFNELFGKQEPGNILADGANRALGKLLSKYYLNKGLGIGTYTMLYESCLVPVMDYCSSIWGYNDNDKLDKIHMKAIRCYLGVNRYAPKAGIEGEIGWTPPKIRRHLNIEYVRESYCELNLKRSHIAKLRLGILPIHIETGRYNGLDRNMRACLVCNNGDIEDEYHVMFHCSIHDNA